MSRILVVEDDADIASLIVHYLSPAGYDSEVVATGSDALAAARRRPPDLIILDRMRGPGWRAKAGRSTRMRSSP